MRKYLLCGYCRRVIACSEDGKGWNCLDCQDEHCGFRDRKDIFALEVIPYQGCCDSCLRELLNNIGGR